MLLKRLWLLALLLVAVPAWAVDPLQPIAPQEAGPTASQVLTGKNMVTTAITWNAATTARYFFLFDATALPSNGSTTSCTSSHVTGCWLACMFMPPSTTAPGLFTADYTVHPIGTSLFGLVIGISTGAGCGTFTADGSNDYFTTQAK